MKVVKEIIDHLYQNGLLASSQLECLKNQGFYPSHDEQTNEDSEYNTYNTYNTYEDYEDYSDPDCNCNGEYSHAGYCYYIDNQLSRRPGHNRRSGGSTKRADRLLKAVEIANEIGKQQQDWQTELNNVLIIGQSLSKQPTLTQTLQLIRNSKLALLAEIIEKALIDRSLSLYELWEIICFNKYTEIIADPDVKGAAVTAYRQVLTGRKPEEFNKQSWILREDNISWVYNLVLAQRALMLVCDHIFCHNPTLYAREINREYHYHPVAYWVMVILYNARQANINVNRIFIDSCQTVWRNPFNLEGQTRQEIDLWFWNISLIGAANHSIKAIINEKTTEEKQELLCRVGRDLDEQHWQQSWAYALICDPVHIFPLFVDLYLSWPSEKFLLRYSEKKNGKKLAAGAS